VSEREVQIPWSFAHARPPCLDVGCAESSYLAYLPAPADGIDSRACNGLPLRQCFQGDIRTFTFPEKYRTVLAVSTLEHVGLAVYGHDDDDVDNGDRAALEGCVNAVEPGGQVLLTVPFGEAGNFGWWRRYNLAGLRALLDGYVWSATYRTDPGWEVKGVALVTVLCA